jgi:hypothetical protein
VSSAQQEGKLTDANLKSLFSTIHLLGNYINQAPFEGRDDYDDMSDDEEDYSFDEEDEEEGSDIDMADLEKVVGRKGKSDSQ